MSGTLPWGHGCSDGDSPRPVRETLPQPSSKSWLPCEHTLLYLSLPPSPDPCPEEQVLRVGFAGVAVGCPEGVEQWLASQLLGRRVWCTLLERHQRTVQCVVHTRRRVRGRGGGKGEGEGKGDKATTSIAAIFLLSR